MYYMKMIYSSHAGLYLYYWNSQCTKSRRKFFCLMMFASGDNEMEHGATIYWSCFFLCAVALLHFPVGHNIILKNENLCL
jgi:hypothetical protein